jgi:hypothetical protein
MKYIKTYDSNTYDTKFNSYSQKIQDDISYLAKKQGTGTIRYIIETIIRYKLTVEQIHNLKLAIEYCYLDVDDFKNVVNDSTWYNNSERLFKIAYEKNFEEKIKKIKKPYPICFITWNKYPLNIQLHYDLNSHDFSDVIGEIPSEYPFGKKYLVGLGRYRSENNNGKTLWEHFKNKKRRSDFIRVFDEKEIYILTPNDIEAIEIGSAANKYNL